jgi:hypothetical protein
MQALVVTITACLSIAVVFGTDVFFTVVGRTALARASDSAVLEVMAHLHAVADRRMPVFGVAGLVGTGLLLAFGPQQQEIPFWHTQRRLVKPRVRSLHRRSHRAQPQTSRFGTARARLRLGACVMRLSAQRL